MRIHLYIIITYLLIILCSCQGNPLKTNQEKLEKDLQTAENEKKLQKEERIAREKILADSLAKLPKGFRFNENRDVDPANPPLELNIADNLNNIRDFKLSDIASEIRYVRMESVPDSTFSTVTKYKYYLLDDYIVALNYFGIQLFDKNGKFIKTIVKNELTDVKYDVERHILLIMNTYTHKGSGGAVWGNGNNLFYVYSDNVSGQKYILKYDCTSASAITNNRFDPERADEILGLGKVVVDLNYGTTKPLKPRNPNGMFSFSPEGFYQGLGTFLLDANTCAIPMQDEKNMLGIFNNRGDTLATFTLQERLKNYTKTTARGTDFGTEYENNGKLFYRSPFNDTIFQVIPPNHLLPVFVLKLGKYKVSKQNGIDPDFDLADKIIPAKWADTKDYVFLTYTKDSYDCPNTRKNKTLKIYHALFSKARRQLYIIKGDPYDYSRHILENNIDGGPAVWPFSYMISNNNEILIALKGIELKNHVNSKQFTNSTVSAEKKEIVKNLASVVSDSEDILMIVK